MLFAGVLCGVAVAIGLLIAVFFGSEDAEAGFELDFGDGLAMTGDASEKFAEQMTRFAGGAAYVMAIAEVKE